MELELSRAGAPETPASAMAEQIIEHVADLMLICGGIESLSATKYVCGFGERLHVTIAPFANAPKEVTAQGVIIKDALARILSVANITRVVTKPSDEDLKKIKEMWDHAVKDSHAVNAGSAQEFVGNGSAADVPEM